MNVLRYPFKGVPADSASIEEVMVSQRYTYTYTYRLKESQSDWGQELPYIQGTQLSFGNNSGRPLVFTIEFITRTYLFGVEQPPAIRRQQTFTIETTSVMVIDAATVAPPGPVTSTTFVVSVQVGFTLGPAVPFVVTGSYQLKEGPIIILTGTLAFSETNPSLWQSAGVALPVYINPTPLSRDLFVDVVATPTGGYANAVASSIAAIGYWTATVIVPVVDSTVYRELMSNYQNYWMQMDRLPGVRHSFKPAGGDISADDLYTISVMPVAEAAPYLLIHSAILGASPGGWGYESTEVGWTNFTSPAGTITGLRVLFTPNAASASTYLVVAHPTAGEWQTSVDPSMIGVPQDIAAIPSYVGSDAAGTWSVFLRDYSYSGGASLADLTVIVKG